MSQDQTLRKNCFPIAWEVFTSTPKSVQFDLAYELSYWQFVPPKGISTDPKISRGFLASTLCTLLSSQRSDASEISLPGPAQSNFPILPAKFNFTQPSIRGWNQLSFTGRNQILEAQKPPRKGQFQWFWDLVALESTVIHRHCQTLDNSVNISGISALCQITFH
jgi:hypothetical protein